MINSKQELLLALSFPLCSHRQYRLPFLPDLCSKCSQSSVYSFPMSISFPTLKRLLIQLSLGTSLYIRSQYFFGNCLGGYRNLESCSKLTLLIDAFLPPLGLSLTFSLFQSHIYFLLVFLSSTNLFFSRYNQKNLKP